MKKLFILLSSSLLLLSCGTQKQASSYSGTTQSLGAKMEQSEAQRFAEDPMAVNIRAWAKANDYDDQDARREAAAIARASVAAQISVYVKDGFDRFSDKTKNVSPEEKKQIQTKISSAKNHLQEAVEEVVRGIIVVKSDTYKQKDGSYDAYVAVELNKEKVSNMLNDDLEMGYMLNSLANKYKKEFDDSMNEAFEANKAKKQ